MRIILTVCLFFSYAVQGQTDTLQVNIKETDSMGKMTIATTIIASLAAKLGIAGNGSQLTGLTKAQVGLVNVDNTTDLNKPLSTATINALALKPNIINGGVGYTSGGSVTQTGNKGTAVTLNSLSGRVTMVNSALAAAAEVSFTVNNNTVALTDLIIVNIQSVGTAGAYFVSVGSVSNGSFTITLGNVSTGSLSQAVVLSFAVIKG